MEDQGLPPVALVDPFIGTGGHGHTYPGAVVPFGMVQLSPDTRLEGWDGCSGYHYSDTIVYGFSHTHLSGTGVADYADLLLMPMDTFPLLNNGAEDYRKGYADRFSHDNEVARPGYYSTWLEEEQIRVELTATPRCGFHRYTFQEPGRHFVIIDLAHRDRVISSVVRIVNAYEIEGWRRSSSWAADQQLFFVLRFSKPVAEWFFDADTLSDRGAQGSGKPVRGWLAFDLEDTTSLQVKVGISAVDSKGARKNLDAELPHDDFDRAVWDAEQLWAGELGKIMVSGGSLQQRRIFYTALYHAFLAPNIYHDVDGRYRGRDHKVHRDTTFNNYTVFSLWDTFRAEHPLFTIVQQERTRDFLKTFLAQFRQGGRLPVWELAANETECMIGYHSVPVITDAYVKGLGIEDTVGLLDAMVHSAMLDHFGLKSYREMGYVAGDQESESVSKTLEYAYDDWCIGLMAEMAGRPGWADSFFRRSLNYRNLFDPSTGFFRARMNGRWFSPFDPHEVNFNYTEANAWQYSLFVPHDLAGLTSLLGGPEGLEKNLDSLFATSEETTGRQQADITGLIGQYAHGNEPSHHMAWLYYFTPHPAKSMKMVRHILDEMYQDRPDGLCGNEDCGQMSAWYVMSAMGFYPVTPGTDFYLLGSPLFDTVRINLENGKEFLLTTHRKSGPDSYIKSVKINGVSEERLWIRHSEIVGGGEIEIKMTGRESEAAGRQITDYPSVSNRNIDFVPVPVVSRGEQTFFDSTTFVLEDLNRETEIYYTTDGSMPDKNSIRYEHPVTVNNSFELKAVALDREGVSSLVLTAPFHKIPEGRKISLESKYAPQYSAGGDHALIDFIRGSTNFRTGAWQGFQGVDLVATVDLGSIQLITEAGCGFLEDPGSWIFFPEEVRFYCSNDGEKFEELGVAKNRFPEIRNGSRTADFSVTAPRKCRWVKVVAVNRGECPGWHPGAGHPAWIFADEIFIR
ncbi:MAG: hypothetical protein Kow00127_16890 [Bacteroidales bacterium]